MSVTRDARSYRSAALRVIVPVGLTALLFAGTVFFVVLPATRSALINARRAHIRSLGQTVRSLLDQYEAAVRAGERTLPEAQAAASARLRDLRYGQASKDYFWVVDRQLRMVMHPYRPELEGADLSQYADAAGKRVFVEVAAQVASHGEGYVEYQWQWNDERGTEERKLSYVTGFAPWGWIIGTGVYLRDVESEVAAVVWRLTWTGLLVMGLVLGLSGYVIVHGLRTAARRQRGADRAAALDALRKTVWQMRGAADIVSVREAVGHALRQGHVGYLEYGINLIHADTDPAHITFHTRMPDGHWRVSDYRDPDIIDALVRAWKARQPLYRPDLHHDDRYGVRQQLAARAGAAIRAVIDVPFNRGTLAVNSTRPQAFAPEDVQYLLEIATVLSEGFRRLDDLRDLALSEERYRTLVETPPDTVVMLMDPAGSYLYISPQIETLTGYAAAELQAQPELMAELVHPDDAAAGTDIFVRAAQGEAYQTREVRVTGRDGTMRWLTQSIFPIRNPDGRVEAVQAVFRDVTDRRQAEENLLQSSRLIALGQMAAGIAHELNQPLTAISVVGEGMKLLQSRGVHITPEQIDEDCTLVLQQVERMHRIIEHLRVFSRDRSAQPKEAVMLDTVVANAQQMIGSQLRSHGIELVLDLAPELPAVQGDPFRLEQVLVNLMANARDALDERSERERCGLDEPRAKRLTVRTRCADGQVLLEVVDTGVGISESDRQVLFQPFFTTKEPDRGTGLGLSIAYAIVKDHRGSIECESEPGAGALFRVRLPSADVPPAGRT